MRRRMKVWLLASVMQGLSLGAGPAFADPPSDRSNEIEILVGQLSADDYLVREAAADRLAAIGEPALSAVERAARGADPERRHRAGRLLTRLRERCFEQQVDAFVRDTPGPRGTLPGWNAFERLVGPQAGSRTEFARMYRADTRLIRVALGPADGESALDDDALAEPLESRVVRLRRRSAAHSRGPGGESDLLAEALAVFLVAAARPDAVTPRACQLLTQTARGELSAAARGGGQRTRVARRLLTEWILSSKTQDLYVLSQMLQLADELRLERASRLALAIATGERPVRPSHPQFRATALLMLGKLGGVDDIPAIAPLLADQAVCASQSGRGGRQASLLDVQVRDVALAVTIHLAGERPRDFGFEDAATHADRLFVMHTLAFASEPAREGAMARWRGAEQPGDRLLRVAEGDAKIVK